ncbi:MAG TPA: protein-glutamate O-methyltransferase CheR [Gemmatimonadales bacterium]|nr:protein-glutamate O-methyltransferase CheR [Gemmatimonadales bacterium]
MRWRTGLVFSETRRSTFAVGFAKAMRRAGLADPAMYLGRIDVDPELLDDLVGEITVGETYFFREPAQFAVIRDEILPALRSAHSPDRPLRIWSAGCASGEEAYSLAILVRELGPDWNAHIVGTDLSRAALAKASHGRYVRWSLRGVSPEVVQAYFTQLDNRFELVPAVRAAVDFRYLNLADDTYPSLSTGVWGMDLIVCRNVLIYFDAETIARVARRLIDSLSENGWLFLGASDPMLADLGPCDVVMTSAGLAYRRATAARVLPVTAAPRPAEPLALPMTELPPPLPAQDMEQSERAADDAEAAVRCYATRDYAGAVEHAERVVRRNGSEATPWIVLIRAHANRGDLAAAGRVCAAALERHANAAELHYLHAVLLSEADRGADAAAAARRALYLDRGLVVAHLSLGGALARLSDTDGARRAFRNAERLLVGMPPAAVVPASDGEPAGRLVEMARVQLRLLGEAAA